MAGAQPRKTIVGGTNAPSLLGALDRMQRPGCHTRGLPMPIEFRSQVPSVGDLPVPTRGSTPHDWSMSHCLSGLLPSSLSRTNRQPSHWRVEDVSIVYFGIRGEDDVKWCGFLSVTLLNSVREHLVHS